MQMVPTTTITVLDVGFTLPQVLNTAGLVVNWMGTIPMIVIAISLGVAATALVIRWVRSSLPQG
jgi:hypothetical protein